MLDVRGGGGVPGALRPHRAVEAGVPRGLHLEAEEGAGVDLHLLQRAEAQGRVAEGVLGEGQDQAEVRGVPHEAADDPQGGPHADGDQAERRRREDHPERAEGEGGADEDSGRRHTADGVLPDQLAAGVDAARHADRGADVREALDLDGGLPARGGRPDAQVLGHHQGGQQPAQVRGGGGASARAAGLRAAAAVPRGDPDGQRECGQPAGDAEEREAHQGDRIPHQG